MLPLPNRLVTHREKQSIWSFTFVSSLFISITRSPTHPTRLPRCGVASIWTYRKRVTVVVRFPFICVNLTVLVTIRTPPPFTLTHQSTTDGQSPKAPRCSLALLCCHSPPLFVCLIGLLMICCRTQKAPPLRRCLLHSIHTSSSTS